MKYLITFILTFTLLGCDIQPTISMASGTIHNPFLEEPLIGPVKKYETALLTSNSIIDGLSKDDSLSVYEHYFSNTLKRTVDRDSFKEMIDKAANTNGDIQEFKPLQWSFSTVNLETGKHLVSTKYVQHENFMIKIDFIFALNSDYLKIEGLQLNPIKKLSS